MALALEAVFSEPWGNARINQTCLWSGPAEGRGGKDQHAPANYGVWFCRRGVIPTCKLPPYVYAGVLRRPSSAGRAGDYGKGRLGRTSWIQVLTFSVPCRASLDSKSHASNLLVLFRCLVAGQCRQCPFLNPCHGLCYKKGKAYALRARLDILIRPVHSGGLVTPDGTGTREQVGPQGLVEKHFGNQG